MRIADCRLAIADWNARRSRIQSAIGNPQSAIERTVAAKGDRVTDGTRPVLLMAASFPT
jgi:hypothetical protein